MSTLLSQQVVPLALFILMLGMGMTLRADDFQPLMKRYPLVLLGLIGQFIGLPLLGLLIIHLFGLPPLIAMGLMILTFSPGGATSNLMSFLARGDVPLSVTLTAISSLLTPLTLPVLTWWTLWWWQLQDVQPSFPVSALLLKLVAMTMLPIVLGMLCRWRWPTFAKAMVKPVKWAGGVFMLVVIVALVLDSYHQLPELLAASGMATLILVLSGMALGAGLAWAAGQAGAQRVTFAFEIGVQNAGVALLVTLGLLNNPQMALVPLAYGIIQLIPAALLIGSRALFQSDYR